MCQGSPKPGGRGEHVRGQRQDALAEELAEELAACDIAEDSVLFAAP